MMNNKTVTYQAKGRRSFVRQVRGLAEGVFVVLAFGLVILLAGTPLALLARGVHHGMTWLVAPPGETSAAIDAFVSVSSVIGTVILVAVVVRAVARFVNWRLAAGP